MHSADNNGITIKLADENATLAYARRLSNILTPGLVINLQGDLGAGKTTLVRGLLQALGYTGRVKSPTYTLLEPYSVGNWEIRHFDLYRMNTPLEWESAGFNDEVNGDNVFLIEWPAQAQGQLPPPDLEINFDILDDGRAVTLQAFSPKGIGCIKRF